MPVTLLYSPSFFAPLIVIVMLMVVVDDVDEIHLVVSVLVLNMLGNKSHRVDRFLKVRLLKQQHHFDSILLWH